MHGDQFERCSEIGQRVRGGQVVGKIINALSSDVKQSNRNSSIIAIQLTWMQEHDVKNGGDNGEARPRAAAAAEDAHADRC